MARKTTELIDTRGGLNHRPQNDNEAMKRNDLQTIMCRAWRLFRSTGKAFAVCLSRAWALYRLTKRMRAGVVRFAYEKADGSLRKACGTLHDVASTVKRTERPDDGQTVKYYDIEAHGWRSFKVENLIAVY